MDEFAELYALLKGSGGGGGGGSTSGYKGSVASAANLPASASKGDMYYVEDVSAFYLYDGGWNTSIPKAITTEAISALWL